jgi:4-hydroxy-2-oxoheptanedioate aldolase
MEIGTVLSLPGAAIAELAGTALDFAWIDLEHGALGPAEVQEMAIGLAAAGCAAHVRLASSEPGNVAAVIDAGIDGVVVPCVESALEARTFVSRLRYPPAGRRGFGPRRAARYGRTGSFWSAPESRVACTVQIESRAGVAAAADIASVDGVDAVVVGCSDLSLELDVPQDLRAAALRAAVDDVADAASHAGVRFGLAASGDMEAIAERAAGRADMVVFSTDARIYSAAIDAAAEWLEGIRAAA